MPCPSASRGDSDSDDLHAVGAEAVDVPAGADDLAGAVVGRPAVALRARAGEALGVGAEARHLRERGRLRRDARVDDADHHAGPAAQARAGRGATDGRERRAPGHRADGVGLDRGDAGLVDEGGQLGLGQADREAVERGGPAVDGLAGTDGGEHGVLLGQQLGCLRAAGGGAAAVHRHEGEVARRCGGRGVVGGRDGGDGQAEGEREQAAADQPSGPSCPHVSLPLSSSGRPPPPAVGPPSLPWSQ